MDIETTGPAVDINDTGGGDPEINFQISGTTTFSIGIDNSDSDKLKIGTTAPDASTSITIDDSQNVGIGNTSPTAKLDVDGSAIFNEGSNSVDFRVESNSNTHMLYIDGTNDEIGVNTSTPASGLDVQTSMGLAHTTVTTTATLDQTHNVVLASDASGSFTITLPAASSNSGKVYYIKKTNSSSNAITIDGNSTETIDGATTVLLYIQYDAIRILCDGSNWHIVADERIPHTASMKRTTAQSIAHNTTVDIDFNSEVFDVGSIADITTDKITIKRAGKYLLTGSGGITLDDLDRVSVSIDVEGTAEIGSWLTCRHTATLATTIATASVVVNLAAGDEIDMTMYQYDDSAGGAQNTHTGAGVPTLTVTEIR